MKPSVESKRLLGITRAKGKMFEYSVPLEDHIAIPNNPANLFSLSVAMLGDLAADLNSGVINPEQLKELLKDFGFSPVFFDSYIQSKLNDRLDGYLLLLASAAYYLADLPGNTSVLINKLEFPEIGFEAQGIDKFLYWLLKSNLSADLTLADGTYARDIRALHTATQNYFQSGQGRDELTRLLALLREKIYQISSSRELLLTDVVCAVLNKKISQSVWSILPETSGVALDLWRPTFQKASFISELWPAQRLLATNNIFRGTSAVIQMPTSAGKTKSIEIIIRSSFLSNRSKVCVVVAPFRALCHEITDTLRRAFRDEDVQVNELSDVFQKDFNGDEIAEEEGLQILAVTPEKLVYVLRQSPDLAEKIGLLILDEGHQFDSGTRGVTYELLITTLKKLLPATVQKILISAVISNAEVIGKWLNGEGGIVVRDTSLAPTFRTIGFSSWITTQGRIEYVESANISKGEFFVPRVMESQKLQRKPKERKERFFPEKKDGASVAAYLGLKLVKNGPVAIFCGVKSTASTLSEMMIEAFARGLELPRPSEYSDHSELERLALLHEENFGAGSIECESAKLGILSHHASIPHGVRLATEYAMREGLAKYVVCTSTLAQGVNLPLRYLVFTNIYQAGERIRRRDFHNLIGRAGRSGMQTEGTILFADPEVYDKKENRKEGWRFNSIKELFDASKPDHCASSLLKIFDEIESSLDSSIVLKKDILSIFEEYHADESSLETLVRSVSKDYSDQGFDEKSLRRQLKYKLKIAASIEGHLISALNEFTQEERVTKATELAKETLAYDLASSEQKELLLRLFSMIAKRIDGKVTSEDKKKIYSRTLLGVTELLEIEQWLSDNSDRIIEASGSDNEIFRVVYPVIEKYLDSADIKKLSPEAVRLETAERWISGDSFGEILDFLKESGAWIQAGSQKRKITVHHVVDICEGGLAFDGMLILGAIAELIEGQEEFRDTTVPDSFRSIQKRIKHGLPSARSVQIYELGFSDRVITQKIEQALSHIDIHNNYMLREAFRENGDELSELLLVYPSHFQEVLEKYV